LVIVILIVLVVVAITSGRPRFGRGRKR